MACLYQRRGNIWWWKCIRNGKRIRETTRTNDKKKAQLFMEKRLAELDSADGIPKAPRILIVDIETAPLEVYSWTYWPNFIDPMSQVVKNSKGKPKDWSILTWAAKWLFEADVHSGMVTLEEASEREDGSIMQPLWDLFEEANVVVAHNGDKFDIRRVNYRFAINGLGPASPIQSIDTLKLAKKAFGVPSYRQDYLNRDFGLRRKLKTDFELWERCVSGDQSGLDEMLEYNKGDIFGLEDLYLEIRPWARGPVNLSMYVDNDKPQCGNCLHDKLTRLSQPYTTPAGQYESFRCLGCGAINRSRYNEKTLAQRKKSYLVTAR